MIEPVVIYDNPKGNSVVSGTVSTAATGAALGAGLTYLTQRHLFKHADEYINAIKSQKNNFISQAADKKVAKEFIDTSLDFLKNKKYNKLAIGLNAASSALLTGGIYLIYRGIKRIVGENDPTFEKNTTNAIGVGAIAGGLVSYFSQKSIINSVAKLKDTAFNVFTAFSDSRKIKIPTKALGVFKNVSDFLANAKVSKSAVALTALRGGAIFGATYAVYRGIKALFTKPANPKVVLVPVPEEVMKQQRSAELEFTDDKVIDI